MCNSRCMRSYEVIVNMPVVGEFQVSFSFKGVGIRMPDRVGRTAGARQLLEQSPT